MSAQNSTQPSKIIKVCPGLSLIVNGDSFTIQTENESVSLDANTCLALRCALDEGQRHMLARDMEREAKNVAYFFENLVNLRGASNE